MDREPILLWVVPPWSWGEQAMGKQTSSQCLPMGSALVRAPKFLLEFFMSWLSTVMNFDVRILGWQTLFSLSCFYYSNRDQWAPGRRVVLCKALNTVVLAEKRMNGWSKSHKFPHWTQLRTEHKVSSVRQPYTSTQEGWGGLHGSWHCLWEAFSRFNYGWSW